MDHRPKVCFFPLCDLHHSPMRRVMLEGTAAEETQSFHQCERPNCDRIFRDGLGYSDFAEGRFDASRLSARKCPHCGATLYLSEVDHALKVETWVCTAAGCDSSEGVRSPSSR
jgi:ssDNA-binding Zn-finger/Zn-ribbon topoisomerase 1